jgi:hypothetical protein
MSEGIEIWDLWFPEAAAQGLPFARGRLRAAEVLLVHAAPALLRVEVRDDKGAPIARGDGLRRTDATPMTRLRRSGQRVDREDIWPGEADIGAPVILAGGEVGILTAWWHSEDRQEWRWSIELYNHR